MEFFQEPAFTVFLAIIFTFLVAKIVSFAISNSSTDNNTVVRSVNEGPVAKEATSNRGLRVRSSKGKKRVKFVDDVVIRRVDRFEGSENLVLLDDVEKSRERVDQFGENEDLGVKMTKEQCFDEGSEKVEMVFEKEIDGDNMNEGFSEKGLKSVILDEDKNEVKLDDDDIITDQKEENEVVGFGDNEGKVRIDSVVDDDDDWEGIERSELEKVFAEAVNYLEYGGKGKDKEDDQLAKLSSDVQMELYGLHKVAVEGPCHEPQPMALKVSARAKWNAWQRLGSMSEEAAMEQYIKVLSDSIPNWMHDYSADDDIQGYPNSEIIGKISDPEFERNSELSATPVGDSSDGRSAVEKDDTASPNHGQPRQTVVTPPDILDFLSFKIRSPPNGTVLHTKPSHNSSTSFSPLNPINGAGTTTTDLQHNVSSATPMAYYS
ncbi:hypothetical protein DH2020_008230 [Rehmannia glutinosa]|uniref:ACB domain-containing protein n=1 Tax=Rehmannia glutinosa TaxID=99300 RepID=A0ABR0U1A1_REHGL